MDAQESDEQKIGHQYIKRTVKRIPPEYTRYSGGSALAYL